MTQTARAKAKRRCGLVGSTVANNKTLSSGFLPKSTAIPRKPRVRAPRALFEDSGVSCACNCESKAYWDGQAIASPLRAAPDVLNGLAKAPAKRSDTFGALFGKRSSS